MHTKHNLEGPEKDEAVRGADAAREGPGRRDPPSFPEGPLPPQAHRRPRVREHHHGRAARGQRRRGSGVAEAARAVPGAGEASEAEEDRAEEGRGGATISLSV